MFHASDKFLYQILIYLYILRKIAIFKLLYLSTLENFKYFLKYLIKKYIPDYIHIISDLKLKLDLD